MSIYTTLQSRLSGFLRGCHAEFSRKGRVISTSPGIEKLLVLTGRAICAENRLSGFFHFYRVFDALLRHFFGFYRFPNFPFSSRLVVMIKSLPFLVNFLSYQYFDFLAICGLRLPCFLYLKDHGS
jgi:hypothetical protein